MPKKNKRRYYPSSRPQGWPRSPCVCVAAACLSIGVKTCFPSILPFWAEARVPLFLITRQKAAQRPLWSLVSVFSQTQVEHVRNNISVM
jgi:hypothetical protein